jgi:putative aldouronate transport system permease protein
LALFFCKKAFHNIFNGVIKANFLERRDIVVLASTKRIRSHRPKTSEWITIKRFLPLYILFIPVALYYLIFAYVPMSGVIIAFKDYSLRLGIWESPWIGLKHFERLFGSRTFWTVLGNTFRLAFLRILIGFPVPILLALLMNEMKCMWYKKTVQTLVYLPHFLSWVIVYGFLFSFFSSNGIVNQVIKILGGTAIPFLSSTKAYTPLFIGSALWKESGWGTIIYLSAMSNVDQQLIESAEIDGANRFKRIWHIVLPGIRNVISIQLILSFGGILSVSFEQTLTMMNTAVRPVAEVIDYYIYRMGLLTANNYSFSTAASLFRNVISLFLVLVANRLVKIVEEENALW